MKLNMVEIDSPADTPGHVQVNENESDDISERGSTKRKNSDLDTNIHPPKRQRLTRNRKNRSLELHIERQETVLALKTKVSNLHIESMDQHSKHT